MIVQLFTESLKTELIVGLHGGLFTGGLLARREEVDGMTLTTFIKAHGSHLRWFKLFQIGSDLFKLVEACSKWQRNG